MMVFRILCGEWIEPLWDCMRAADELCMAVFLPTLILGNFIVSILKSLYSIVYYIMVFRILCGEWIEPLWDCMRAADELCMAVFLPTLILGNFIVSTCMYHLFPKS